MAENERARMENPLAAFLAQPRAHYLEGEDVAPVPLVPLEVSWRATGRALGRFFMHKPRSRYSSIAPRRSDATRTGIFPFNGNGWH